MTNTTVKVRRPSHRTSGWLTKLERLLLFLGFASLTVYVAAWAQAAMFSRFALWQFNSALPANSSSPSAASVVPQDVDFSLWPEKRIRAFRESLVHDFDPPIAVLNIPKLRLTVPIFEGTDDLTLNRGLGRIGGTAEVGEDGNIGIAGHRDGFFRTLANIAQGDLIEMITPVERDVYVVDRIQVVEPAEVSVLKARPVPGITLVTCYPFYFVGDAPRRYIVQASLKERNLRSQLTGSAVRTSQTQKEK